MLKSQRVDPPQTHDLPNAFPFCWPTEFCTASSFKLDDKIAQQLFAIYCFDPIGAELQAIKEFGS